MFCPMCKNISHDLDNKNDPLRRFRCKISSESAIGLYNADYHGYASFRKIIIQHNTSNLI